MLTRIAPAPMAVARSAARLVLPAASGPSIATRVVCGTSTARHRVTSAASRSFLVAIAGITGTLTSRHQESGEDATQCNPQTISADMQFTTHLERQPGDRHVPLQRQ